MPASFVIDESMLSDGERRQLAEIRRRQCELRDAISQRLEVQVASLHASKYRYEHACAMAIAADACYHESLFLLAEDPDDDWKTARDKAEKLERIEQEFIEAPMLVDAAYKRCEWELRQV